MATSVTLPALGESVTEGTVTRWLKKVGDTVAVDEPLLEISTDKVDTEIPSPVAGMLLEIKAAEDETVEVGAELAVIGDVRRVLRWRRRAAVRRAAAEEAGRGRAGPQAEAAEPQSPSRSRARTEPRRLRAGARAGIGRRGPGPHLDTGETGDGHGEIMLPALGESVTEGTVTRWLKAVGDEVAVDEPLLEISTDKVDTEIPSPVAGTLLEIQRRRGRDRRGRRRARHHRRGRVRAGRTAAEQQQPEPEAAEPEEEPGRAGGGSPSPSPSPSRRARGARVRAAPRAAGHRSRRASTPPPAPSPAPPSPTPALRQPAPRAAATPTSPRSCASWPSSTASTSRPSPAPASADASASRTCSTPPSQGAAHGSSSGAPVSCAAPAEPSPAARQDREADPPAQDHRHPHGRVAAGLGPADPGRTRSTSPRSPACGHGRRTRSSSARASS